MNPIRRREDANRRRTNGVGGPKKYSSERIGKSRPKRQGAAKKRPARAKRPPVVAKAAPRAVKTPLPVKVSPPVPATPRPGVRLNKYLADQGIASRREVDTLIANKQVLVNGVVATVGQKVSPSDTVTTVGDGGRKQYLAFYKGRGIITHSPTTTEVDIVTRLKKDYGITGVTPVGRLDKDSEGLIILSNDGRITGPLLNPESTNEKEYEVMVDKPVTAAFCKLLELGVMIEGYRTKPAQAAASSKNPKRFNLIITEGKKHQIRRMCAALGYQVESLKRVRIMNITIGALKPNQYRKIAGEELREFLTALGIK